MSENCFICDKHEGNIQTSGVLIYENDYVYVGHIDSEGKPNYLGHIMIDLKRHVPTMAELNPDEARAFGMIMARVSKALKKMEGAEHIYALVSGNSVPHLHMHLVARYPNTPEQYWGPFAVYDSPNARMGDNGKVIEVCNRIKSFLETNLYE
jgi:histidine triad (HIT) family protein